MSETIPTDVIVNMAQRTLYDCTETPKPYVVERMRNALKAAEAMGWVMVPVRATGTMMLAGRRPIMARDCLQGSGDWTLGDHMREGGHEG